MFDFDHEHALVIRVVCATIMAGASSGVLIGISMMPCAEIAMVVRQQERALGDRADPAEWFGGMVFVSVGTSIVRPFVLRALLWRRLQLRNKVP